MRFLVFLTLFVSTPSLSAEVDPALLAHIELRCNFYNDKIPLDVRLDCVSDYVNCAVVGSGQTDLKKADDQCLKRKGKEREYEQLQDASRP